MSVMTAEHLEELSAAATIMLAVARLESAGLRLLPLSTGGNNRVYRLDASGSAYLLKEYFHDQEDQRDRLGVEFGFLKFAWNRGLRCVPQPIARHFACRLGLYGFVEGRRVEVGDVTESRVTEAGRFIAQLNAHRGAAEAAELPLASDACLSLSDHLASIDRRVKRLSTDATDARACAFVCDEVAPRWRRIAGQLAGQGQAWGAALDEPMEMSLRVLSPSDFGFHNALLAGEGRTSFIDFEYAGWDDPAKLAADFFNQVAVPAPITMLDRFVEAMEPDAERRLVLRRRVELLLPAYRLKWCCMTLAAFDPVAARRRGFAGADTATIRDDTLDKARRLLRHVHDDHGC